MYLVKNSNTLMTKATAIHNGDIDSHVGIFHGEVVISSSHHIQIYNTSFTNVPAQSSYSTEDPASLPAVIVIYNSYLHLSEYDFTRNNISAIKAYYSTLTVSDDLTFSNNRAFAGAALALVYNSFLVSTENSHIYFLNNHATNVGGVFYFAEYAMISMDTKRHYTCCDCFLDIQGRRSQTRFTFANNSAGKGGDILYGEQMALCLDDGVENGTV